MKPFSYQTSFRYTDGSKRDIVRARAEYHQIGDQAPYFSITGEVYGTEYIRGEKEIAFNDRARWLHSCGCQHELIARVFPELAPFIKWHLSAADGPMHYIANAVYWVQVAAGVNEHPRPEDSAEKAYENFKSTVVFGALASDALPPHEASPNAPPHEKEYAWTAYAHSMRRTISDNVSQWCEARLPALREAFMRALVAARALDGKL